MTGDLEPFVVRVEVSGPCEQALPILDEFRHAIEHWKRNYTTTQEGNIVGNVEILILAAEDEEDARALVREVIGQIPGAPSVLRVA